GRLRSRWHSAGTALCPSVPKAISRACRRQDLRASASSVPVARRGRAGETRFSGGDLSDEGIDDSRGSQRVCRRADAGVAGWNGERNGGARPIVRLCPEATLMSLDDRAADEQPDAHATALGRVESIE